MAEVTERNQGKVSRRQVDKYAERRAQLASSTLQTLAELGYARTSLREIAQNSEFSHGVLHYYFRDKVDLLTESVRQYEAACVTRYDEVVETATTAEGLRGGFAEAMTTTLCADALMHRLWYDLRNQSLFEETFRADVLEIDERREQMIWRVVTTYAELCGLPPAISSSMAYTAFDGLFLQALMHHLAGRDDAVAELDANVRATLTRAVLPTA
ncbi:TetR/AcrR family transcriptional regulator [Nocardia jejuensis]|uniref:TetR/AcrR family transcriptional regulator n=1 Tax=Nocardia jejuensis TaxID=328049 RepID=UPI0008308DED|nr:TetR/AcrR family transcriptional regulator [Nocardia jejuensis]